MKKAMKKILVALLSALMVLGTLVIPAAADDEECKAVVEGQFDTSFEGNFDEWADLKADYTMTFEKDGLATYKADYGQKVKFSGNYVGFNTNVKAEKDADNKITTNAGLVSVKLDGVEVAIANKSLLTEEGLDGGIRINLTNQWNGDITTQPIAADVWATAFQTIEIEFYVGDYTPASTGANKVVVEGQFDTSFEGNFDEWADLKPDYTSTFDINGLATYKADYGQKVKFSGNYIGLNTDVKKDVTDKGGLVSVKLDGVEVAIAGSFVSEEGLDGGLRLTLTNQWNGDITTQPIDPSVWETAFQTIEIQFYFGNYDGAPAEDPTDAPTEPEKEVVPFDPAGKYKAALGVQFAGTYIFRDGFANASTGIGSGYAGDGKLTIVDGSDIKEEFAGSFTDVEIAGNGTYTVKLEGVDGLTTADAVASTGLNLFYLTTNIPTSGVDTVKFSDVKFVINDEFAFTYKYAEGVIDPDAVKGKKDTIDVLGCNLWNSDEELADANAIFNNDLPATGVKSMSITFTVSGFSYDKAADEAPSQDATTAAPNNNKNEKSGLPTGALIAIICGCAAVVCAVVVCVVVVSKKKKAAK